MLALLRHALATLRNVKLVALHLVVNAVLLASASFWLLIPEAHVWQLFFAGLSALLMLFVFLWLHSGTLAYAVSPVKENFRPSFVIKIWRLFWLLLGIFILFWCMNRVGGWIGSQWQIAGYLYSKAPTWMRPTAGSSSYTTALGYFFLTLYWYVLPSLLLPIITARIAGAGFLRGLRVLWHWQYWLGIAATVLLGVWLTKLIVGWMPGSTLTQQTIGMVIRFTFAYLIATAAWLLTAGVLGYFLASEPPTEKFFLTPVLDKIAPAGGETRSIVNHSVSVIRDRRLILLQLAAGFVAAVMAIWNPSSPPLTWSWVGAVGVVLFVLFVFLWLYSSTIAYAVQPVAAQFRNAFRFHFIRILWLFVGLVVLVLLQESSDYVLWKLNNNDQHFALILHITRVISDYLLPCFLLPWTAAKVMGNHFRDGLIALRSWRYWVGMVVIIYFAQWISDQLTHGSSSVTFWWMVISATLLRTLSILPIVVGWVTAAGLVSYFLKARTSSAADVVGQTVS